jgi:hypothetical protein
MLPTWVIQLRGANAKDETICLHRDPLPMVGLCKTNTPNNEIWLVVPQRLDEKYVTRRCNLVLFCMSATHSAIQRHRLARSSSYLHHR